VLSYHDAIWQMSWGDERASIAALREEMCVSVQHESWLPKSSLNGNGNSQWQQGKPLSQNQTGLQIPGFQAVGFMMTSVPGTQGQVPAMVFTVQQQPDLAPSVSKETGKTALKMASPFRPSNTTCDPSSAAATRIAREHGNQRKSQSSLSAKGSLADEAKQTQAVTHETFDGELPSIGSEGHFDGSCKRCAFFPKGRCTNGKDCSHCHFAHELRPRLRKRCAAGARGRTCEAENQVPGDDISEETCLSEVLSYLAEPVGTIATPTVSDHDTQSERESHTDATEAHDEGEAVIRKFNDAIRKIAETHATPSTSAFSDGEDAVTVSFGDFDKADDFEAGDVLTKDTSMETSDSDTASLHDTIPRSPPKTPSSASSSHGLSARWSHKGNVAEDCSTTDMMRMTRSLLNKLTQERFESLCAKLLALPISTTEQLAVVVAEIFQKATTQNSFRSLYTELCTRLDTHFAAHTGKVGGKAFRKALVSECQATFERNLLPPDASLFVGLGDDDCFEVEMKLKTRRLGNMRFIGDLLVRRLLAPKLLPPIVHELMNGDEGALESLMALLMVVAPEFDMKPSLYQAPVRDACALLQRKFTEKAVSSRICCQINDLLDAKARSWAPRHSTP